MKVLHVITRMDPGGSSYICREIVQRMKDKDYEVYFAYGKSTVDVGDAIKLRFLRRNINVFFDFLALIEIFRLIKKIKPEVLHLHTSKAGMVGRIAGRLAGVSKIYYQPHGIVFYGYFSKLKSKIILFVERILASAADKIIVLTKRAKEEFVEYKVGVSSQYEVIEDGIDFNKFTPLNSEEKNKLKEEYGLGRDDIILGMVGRIVKLKGHDYFIEALSSVCGIYGNVKGIIIGEGEYEEELRRLIKSKELNDIVVFTGYKEDVAGIMPVIDVLIQPSIVEGFGLTIVEAGALEIPAVGFKVGGIVDIIKDNETGMIADYMNAESLVEKIQYLIENSQERLKMGVAARDHIKNNFTLETMMKKVFYLYEVNK